MLQYRIRLKRDTNHTLLVTVPSIPGVVTFGEDRASARVHAVEAIETMLIGYMADHRNIPLPDSPGRGEFATPPALTGSEVGSVSGHAGSACREIWNWDGVWAFIVSRWTDSGSLSFVKNRAD